MPSDDDQPLGHPSDRPRIPSREDLLPISTGNHCLFCGRADWAWAYLLRDVPEWVEQLGWTFGWTVVMCDPCHRHYEQGEDDALVRAHLAQAEPEEDETQLRLWLRVVRAQQSDPAIPRGEAIVPGADDLMAEGFVPIENLTGFREVATVWPEEHRRSIPEVRPFVLEEEGPNARLWAIRPPWPGWTHDDVFTCLWSVVDRHREHEDRLRVAAEVLHWEEPRARAQLQRARDEPTVE
ncbi:MAG: hypothetical protein ACJ735_00220 [Actinomycetes bacterium]